MGSVAMHLEAGSLVPAIPVAVAAWSCRLQYPCHPLPAVAFPGPQAGADACWILQASDTSPWLLVPRELFPAPVLQCQTSTLSRSPHSVSPQELCSIMTQVETFTYIQGHLESQSASQVCD